MWKDHWLSSFTKQISTPKLKQNDQHFADDIFRYILFNETVWILIQIWLKFVPNGLVKKYIIASDNGLSSNRQQAIIWTNDGLIYCCIYASLGRYELVLLGIYIYIDVHSNNCLTEKQIDYH